MQIRPAVPADLKQCTGLDHDFSTTRVWQMNRREDPGRGLVTIDLNSVRLPRPMRVQYPRDPNRLWEDWRNWDNFLVACEDGYIKGYLGLFAHAAQGRVWIRDLIIDRPFRRRGIGTELLKKALEWTRERELDQVSIEMQSKNFPAIHFCQMHGFHFCGFDENYYQNQDIALFFVVKLK
ncbi:MAG: GNAT family N-acetyltransferase [Anaerolineales bacterium]|nr:GNAT family N-acetyltransferase [Anaerolineales bacterium]